MRGQALNYKGRSVALGRRDTWFAALARLEPAATVALWLLAAALIGWAIALALGLWGETALRQQAPWKPFAIDRAEPPRKATAVATVAAPAGALQLFGIADERAYFKSGSKTVSAAVGDTLPGGEKVLRIGRDFVAIASAQGAETTMALFKSMPAKGSAVSAASNASAASTAPAAAASCRLSASDRAMATWIEPAVAVALVGEGKALARMFAVIDPARGGLRAQATGGTTAMFAIADGDVLLRADGQPLRSGEAVATDVIAKVQRGEAVVVEGERGGAARRWVFAPVRCRV